MAVQYNKLFKMMIDRKMTNNQLAKQAGISLNIITRLKRDEYIAMQTIEKICIALDCGVDDILEFIPEFPTMSCHNDGEEAYHAI